MLIVDRNNGGEWLSLVIFLRPLTPPSFGTTHPNYQSTYTDGLAEHSPAVKL